MNPEVQLEHISIDNMKNWNKRRQGKSVGVTRQLCHSQLNECNFGRIYSSGNWGWMEDKK